uniref:RNA-guided endonuclease InsQ/TnpB family protein n=1 Tax=Hassallia byssoidea TaxID=482630 RepID=UPI0019141ED1|nr:RNA-guided endonuclease TnpB family protein [Hassalia byssoidea]
MNNKEVSLLRGISGFKRFVYNYGLSLLIYSWDFENVKATDSKRIDAIKKVFTQVTMQKPENTWMKKYPSTVYQSAFIDLKSAFSRWRRNEAGFPVKKRKRKGDSFTVYKTSGIYPEKGNPALPFTNRVVINEKTRITLPGLKTFRLKEPINYTCSSQTFTVSRTANKWFVSFANNAEKLPPLIHPVEKIGVDLGVKSLATCSDGSQYSMPLTTKQAKIKLSKIQWHNRSKVLGNKKLGVKASKNALDFYSKVATLHARIANIRQDTTQKMTTDLSRKAYVIRIEDLNVQGMIANQKLAAAGSNNTLQEIRRQLTYKQAHYGTKVELVDRWYPSSKMCQECQHIQPMKLSERVFKCSKCGVSQDRDANAAINLERAPDSKVRLA